MFDEKSFTFGVIVSVSADGENCAEATRRAMAALEEAEEVMSRMGVEFEFELQESDDCEEDESSEESE